MKSILKIVLLLLIVTYSINAKEQYSQENIGKHLEVLFTKNLKYEKHTKSKRYLPFSNTINFYYEFSPSIKNKNKKIEVLKEVAKEFEKVINLKIELKKGKPDIAISEQNGKQKTTYNSQDSYFEEHIYFDFSTRDEIFKKLEHGFWNKIFFLGMPSKRYQQFMDYMKRERSINWK